MLHLLFFLSGAAALIYQVVWTRELVLVFGATVQSASIVLAAFMAGFGAGGLWGGAYSRRTRQPLLGYGLLELGIALAAALFPWSLRLAEPLYMGAGLATKALVTGALLFPATFLMGATFPVLLRAVESEFPERKVASLFTANTLGACAGVLLAGFVLVGAFGLSATSYIAIALNILAGAGALWISRDHEPLEEILEPQVIAAKPWALGVYFFAGLCGMASEVVWYRVLLPSFNNSVYGFSTVLGIYLLGLALGSWLSVRLWLKDKDIRAGLGAVLAAAGVYSLAALYIFEFSQLLTMRYADFYAMGVRPLLVWPLCEAACVLLPVATVQGMILPLVIRLLAPKRAETGGLVGRLYAANTFGCILGSLFAGFWWIPFFSVQRALLVVVSLYAGLGLAVLAANAGPRRRIAAAVVACAAALLIGRAWTGRDIPAQLILEWVQKGAGGDADLLRYTEDSEASVAVMRRGPRPFLIINGVGVAGYTNVTKTLAHLPLLLHPDPKRMLVICFGLGTTWRSALAHPGLEVDAVDLVPSVLDSFPLFYRKDFAEVLANPRGRRHVGDGRGFLTLSKNQFDVIVVDPSPPLYSAGTVNIYNKDFYKLAVSRLSENGLLAVWLPEYPEGEFNMVLKSFFEAVPYAQLWKGSTDANGFILLGSRAPISSDRAALAKRFKSAPIQKDWLEMNKEFEKPEALFSLYWGPKERFAAALSGVDVVTDDKPWIEYPYFRSKRPSYFKAPSSLRLPPVPF